MPRCGALDRGTSAPAAAGLKICTICYEAIEPDEEYKWYNEHNSCGNSLRMAERLLRKPQHKEYYFYYLLSFKSKLNSTMKKRLILDLIHVICVFTV